MLPKKLELPQKLESPKKGAWSLRVGPGASKILKWHRSLISWIKETKAAKPPPEISDVKIDKHTQKFFHYGL